jgi:glutathione synthase/RimK-type ligase-like ATP-grasp enzyme
METPNGYTVHEVNCAMEFKESLKAVQTDIPARIIDYCVRVGRKIKQGRKKEYQHEFV